MPCRVVFPEDGPILVFGTSTGGIGVGNVAPDQYGTNLCSGSQTTSSAPAPFGEGEPPIGAVEEVSTPTDPDYAQGFGDLTGHEVAVSEMVSNRLYFSYYAAGFRVAEIENGQIVEKGHYIANKGNNFWGVQVFEQGGKEYVAASDRDSGLWIFHYQG